MADKKYYWLKLPKDFFSEHYIMMLRARANGNLLVLFYIWLLTESIAHEGRLRYSDKIPYTPETLSMIAGFETEFVGSALQTLTELELIATEADGTIILPKCLKMIGSEGESAERVRRYRERQQNVKKPEKPKKDNGEAYKEIIDYLNKKTGSHYKNTSKSTQRVIGGRIKEGFSVEDFKKVIDTKSDQWLTDKKMCAYLRPETLFAASHFESYLNEYKEKPKKYSGLSERLDKETQATLTGFVDNGEFA